MMANRAIYISLLLVFALASSSMGQEIGQDYPFLEDYIRRLQLEGKWRWDQSFHQRPLSVSTDPAIDSTFTTVLHSDVFSQVKRGSKKLVFKMLPLKTTQQYIPRHPLYANDGSMIPASGYQQLTTGGLYAKWKFISLDLRPQYVFAQNKKFQGFPVQQGIGNWLRLPYSVIDRPERFGEVAYSRFDWGNSQLKLILKPISIGFGNQNRWWGPAMVNPLMFSYHAPGFRHGFIQSNAPIKTKYFSFEFSLMGGYLKNSGFKPPQFTPGNDIYLPRPNEKRYLNSVNISLQPTFAKGLSIGISRSIMMYESLRKDQGGWLFVFGNLSRKRDRSEDYENKRDQIGALHVRYFESKSQFEVYAEWGRADAYYNVRDFIQSVDHTQGYTLGFRKLFGKEEVKYQLMTEFTRLQKNSGSRMRLTPSWYVHATVRHGFTNNGEVMGAPIGTGSNQQLLRFSRIKGINQWGVEMSRTLPNVDFYQDALEASDPSIRKWMDLGIGFFADHQFKNLVFSGKILGTRSFNYQWYQPPGTEGIGFNKEWDVSNVLLQAGLTYLF